MTVINFRFQFIFLPPTQTREQNVAFTATPSIKTALHIFAPAPSIFTSFLMVFQNVLLLRFQNCNWENLVFNYQPI